MTWINAPVVTPDSHGFVYKITEVSTGMIYIGIKKFWKIVKLKPLKGKKNKRHFRRETDWRNYTTSSPIMQLKLESNPSEYINEMVMICDTQVELKCHEAYIQLKYYMSGEWDKLYNEVINLRLRIRKNKVE